jgi:ATP-dependent RNA helicase DeaD
MGINSAALHGDIAQERRTRIMKTFKHAEKMVLVASDVAARGIDVDNIDLVINYDFPQENELYIHRIGRTGRAGKQGVAITLCKTKKDLRLVKQLMKYTKSNIDERQMPSNEELVKVHNELFIKKVVEESKKGLNDENLNIANDLLKEGLQAQDIVCALISLANPKPILVTSKKKKKSNSRDRDRDHGRDRGRDNKQASRSNKSNNSNSNKYEVITINAGRNDGINVHKAINILKKNGKLKDHAIGNIDIQRLKTTVEVTSKEAKQAMQKMSNVSYNGKNLTISMKHERKSRKRK